MDEWGPWIAHDGRGCPLQPGTYVRVKTSGGETLEGVLNSHIEETPTYTTPWHWANWCGYSLLHYGHLKFLEYQVRKPRALQELRELVENLPHDVRETEDA